MRGAFRLIFISGELYIDSIADEGNGQIDLHQKSGGIQKIAEKAALLKRPPCYRGGSGGYFAVHNRLNGHNGRRIIR